MNFCTQQQVLNITLRLFICLVRSDVNPTDRTCRHWFCDNVKKYQIFGFVQHSSVENQFQSGTDY